MSNFNKIFLMGRLTKDPELRYTPQGVPVADLGLAVNREYSTSSGERRKDTLFIDVTVWRKQAEICCQYLKKGRPLFVEGRLEMDTWDAPDGQRRTRYRVVADNFQFIDGGGGRRDDFEGGDTGQGAGQGAAQGSGTMESNYGGDFRRGGVDEPAGSPPPPPEGVTPGIPDEDIPF